MHCNSQIPWAGGSRYPTTLNDDRVTATSFLLWQVGKPGAGYKHGEKPTASSSESFIGLGSASFLLWPFLGSRSHLFMRPYCGLVSSQPRHKENEQSCSVSASCRRSDVSPTVCRALHWKTPHTRLLCAVTSTCMAGWGIWRPWRHIWSKPLCLEGVFVCGLLWMEAGDVSLGCQLEQLSMFNASHALFYYTSNPLCLQRRKSCQRPLIQTEFNLSNSIYSGRAAKSIY